MKDVISLTRNELIKLGRQWSFRIITLVFALLIVAMPFISYFSEKATERYKDGFDAEAVEHYKQYYDNYMANEDYCEAAVMKAQMDTLQYFIDHDFSRDSGEYFTYFDEYKDALRRYRLMTVLPYEKLDTIIGNYYMEYYIDLYDSLYGVPEGVSEAPDEDDEDYKVWTESEDTICIRARYYSLKNLEIYVAAISEVKFAEMAEEAEKSKKAIETAIENYTVSDLYRKLLTELATEVQSQEYSIEFERARYSELTTAIDKARSVFWVRYAQNKIEEYKVVSSAINLLLEKEAPLDGWEYRTYEMISDAACTASQFYYYDEVEYEPEEYDGLSYSEYLKEMNEGYAAILLAMDQGLYSIEHSLPLNGSGAAMAKYKFETQITVTGLVILIVLSVMAGSIFASEYSTGTIRLLLIRPQARYKICLSKIAAVLIYGIGLLIFALIAMFLLDGTLFGFDGYSMNSIYVFNGKIHEIPAFVKLIIIIVQDTVSILPLVMLAFLLSILTKRSPLAIASSLILSTAGSLSQQLCTKLYAVRVRYLKYTPLPYSQLSYFRVDPSIAFFSYYDIITVMTESVTQDYIMHSLPWLGTLYHILFTGILTFLCFWFFDHQQIKN